MSQKFKAFKVKLNGAENSPCIEKCPATDQDVVAALAFLTEVSELVVTLVGIEQNENGEFVECQTEN